MRYTVAITRPRTRYLLQSRGAASSLYEYPCRISFPCDSESRIENDGKARLDSEKIEARPNNPEALYTSDLIWNR